MMNLAYWVGMIVCALGAMLGQAELIGEPYRHYVTIAFIVGTAVNGYMISHPPPMKPPA